jgi:hypothetical protein
MLLVDNQVVKESSQRIVFGFSCDFDRRIRRAADRGRHCPAVPRDLCPRLRGHQSLEQGGRPRESRRHAVKKNVSKMGLNLNFLELDKPNHSTPYGWPSLDRPDGRFRYGRPQGVMSIYGHEKLTTVFYLHELIPKLTILNHCVNV